jgi:hypothetical protein
MSIINPLIPKISTNYYREKITETTRESALVNDNKILETIFN